MRILLILTVLAAALAGCKGPEEAPVYLDIRPPRFLLAQTGDTAYGQVPDVWLYPAGQYWNTTTPPAVVPYTLKDTPKIVLAGGVRLQDDPGTPSLHPFWKLDTVDITGALPGQTVVVQPTFRYQPDSVMRFPLDEEFDDPGLHFSSYGVRTDTTHLYRKAGGAFGSQYCGRADFDSTHKTLEVMSDEYFTLPIDGSPIWVEVTYRGNIRFALSFEQTYQASLQVLTPWFPQSPYDPDNWRTVYIDPTKILNQLQPSSLFRVYLLVLSDGADRFIEFDRIRVLYYKGD